MLQKGKTGTNTDRTLYLGINSRPACQKNNDIVSCLIKLSV